MARRKKLPASGSDTQQLARYLKKTDVWRILYLLVRQHIEIDQAHDRLFAIGVLIGREQIGQLAAIAFTEAKSVGAD